MNNSRKSTKSPTYQILEPRKLLAGDVTVSVDGLTLNILGDVDANQIQIIGTADGSATVSGLDGTTINGGIAEFSANANLRTARIQMGDGNDEVEIRGLVLRNSLTVRTGDGDDATDIQHINVRGIEVSGGDGNDVMQFDNVFSRRSIVVGGGNGDDTVAIGAMAARRDGLIDTGNGDDSLVVDNLGIKENMSLLFGAGDDQALIAGETYGYRGNIVLGEGNDSLSILPATNEAAARFRRNLTISGNGGSDAIAMDASVSSLRRSRIDGGVGNDAIQQGDASLRRSNILNFESAEIADLNARLDTFYSSLTASGIDVSRFGGTTNVTGATPVLTVNAAALSQSRDGDPQSIDDTLTLTGDDEEVVSSATVVIGGFQTGEETLVFNDTADITGAFTNGTLTLTGEASLTDYQTALRSVTYAITSAVPSTADRTLNITVNFADTNESAVTGSRTVNVVAENLLAVTDTGLTLNEGAAATAIDDGLRLSGNSTTEVTGAEILLSNFQSDTDQLVFEGLGTIIGIVTTDTTANTATLTLSGQGTVAEYQAALRSATFQNTREITESSTRTADITVTTNNSDLTGARTITLQPVNSAPVLSGRFGPVVMNVGVVDADGNVQPVSINSIDDPISIADSDSQQLSRAIVTIDDGRIDGDVLNSTPQTGITGTFDAATGVLTFIGDADVADYESVLRSITFGTNDAANLGQRTLSIEITDVSGSTEVAATDRAEIRIDVVTSQTARVTASSENLVVNDGDFRTTVDPLVQVVGNPSSTITTATVQLSSGYQTGEDVLGFEDVFEFRDDIEGEFDAITGTLTLSLRDGADVGASRAEAFQATLRNVYYQNAANERTSGDRSVVFTVNTDTTSSDTRVLSQGNFDRVVRDNALLDRYIADNNLTNVQTTSSGLRYIVETVGNGTVPTATDSVRVNYTGVLLSGSEFDQNDDITFPLQNVIDGWTEGFQFFSEGGSGKLLIPSNLAYGGNPRDGIPTFSNLIFDIDLLEVNPS